MMKKSRPFGLISLVLMFIVASNTQAAPVFKVSKNKQNIYIGGTFHILTENDFPLQDAFYEAYKNADEVYFETDIEGTQTNPKFQSLMMAVMVDQTGKQLDSALNPATFAKVKAYTASKGLPLQQLMALTPIGFMLNITIIEYQARGFKLAGVDEHFFTKAKADKKVIRWFESLEEQVAFIESLDNQGPNELINYLLDSMSEVDEIISGLHSSWREGDMAQLAQIGLDEFKDYPEIYDTLIKKRNDTWMLAIEPMFEDDNTELLLVGALHLPGKDGLITQLLEKGYTVEQIK